VARGVAVLDDGSAAIVIGEFEEQATFTSATSGSIALNEVGQRDAFVAKISSGGEWLWASGAGGSGARADGRGLASLSNGTILVTGTFEKAVSFGTSALTSDDGSKDVFVACLSAAGSFGC
jgi:hypothetical protein